MTITDTAEAIQKVASAAVPTGGVVAMGSGAVNYFGLSKDEWTLVFAGVGALVAVVGFLVSWYYKHQTYKLALAKAPPGLMEE
jgi:hypothetical protein